MLDDEFFRLPGRKRSNVLEGVVEGNGGDWESSPAADGASADQLTPILVGLLSSNRQGRSMCSTREVDWFVGRIKMKNSLVVVKVGDETCCSLLLSINWSRL